MHQLKLNFFSHFDDDDDEAFDKVWLTIEDNCNFCGFIGLMSFLNASMRILFMIDAFYYQ